MNLYRVANNLQQMTICYAMLFLLSNFLPIYFNQIVASAKNKILLLGKIISMKFLKAEFFMMLYKLFNRKMKTRFMDSYQLI